MKFISNETKYTHTEYKVEYITKYSVLHAAKFARRTIAMKFNRSCAK